MVSDLRDLAAGSFTPDSDDGLMLLDDDLRIHGVSSGYERLAMRQRAELVGNLLFDLFPDDPDDPQASGTSQLGASLEAVLRRGGVDTMPIMRYDIVDPLHPDAFIPSLWTISNTAIDDGDKRVAVLLRARPIKYLDEALSALTACLAGGATLGAAEQVHILAALAARVREQRESFQALSRETDQLRAALETRDLIGQAKGKIMERFDVDANAAFGMLTKLSQQSNTPVKHVAQKLIDLGALTEGLTDGQP
jgi:ANTAR domain